MGGAKTYRLLRRIGSLVRETWWMITDEKKITCMGFEEEAQSEVVSLM